MADLTALAFQSAVSISASELHGLVCGLAVGGAGDSLIAHLAEIVGGHALSDQRTVEEFVTVSIDELRSEELIFSPLLPGDDAALRERVEAIAEWCAGFLVALAAASGAGPGVDAMGIDGLPEEVNEIVADFAAISEADYAEDAAASSAEHDFVHVVEYVKVGVLLMWSLLDRDRE